MEAFIVVKNAGNMLHAMLICKDGSCLAEHVCSHVSYCYGDLWGNRPERQEKWPHLKVGHHIYAIDEFKKDHAEIFDKAFVEKTVQ